ncbi:6-phosphogluconolactonase [Neisseria perflava]|uniref:6-phosphogluconolactonase n=1 Tax=Neisseria perflava TaxID=33053 RepID=UPI0020A0A065|nr:6-phosphogluconolactonase [Neisseria perflava]MCP1772592.1 6-phosphogluconolactonase [Neisseria perflava]
MYTVQTFESAEAYVQALAGAIAADLQQAIAAKGEAVLVVSGGKSPIALFKELSQKDIAWDKVKIGLVDERIVPTNHADSNTALAHEYLLQNKAAAAVWIPMVEAGKSETELQPEAVVAFALKHYKCPDVAILGMGPDGHTASLFPKAPQLQAAIDLNNNPVLAHTTPVTAPHERVTMSLAEIVSVPHLYLALQGAEKKALFDQASAAPTLEYPISLVVTNEKANCHVFYAN